MTSGQGLSVSRSEETQIYNAPDGGPDTARTAADGPAVPVVGAPVKHPPEGAAPPLNASTFRSSRNVAAASSAFGGAPLPGVQRDAGEVQEIPPAPPEAPKVEADAPPPEKPAQKPEQTPAAKPAAKKKQPKQKNTHVVQPVAPPARMRRRHWGLLFGMLILVVLPLIGVAGYMWGRAADQYASLVGFTVRSEESGSASDLIGGALGSLGGGTGQKDTDILYEFIQSQGLVNRIQERFDIRALYSKHWETDPVFAIAPDASAEDLLAYWTRMTTVSYDQSSGLIEMRVQAFEPKVAQDVANAMLEESQDLINTLNAQARADTIRYAQNDLEDSLNRLKSAREALTLFRTRTQIVDPQSDLEGRLGVVANLQQQLAQALIEQDLLLEQTSRDDPRLVQARRKIEVIRARIDQERANVSSGGATSAGDDSYPRLLAEYEGLQVDQEFAEQSYRAALTALDIARNNASRQSRYLATYIAPTFPQTAQYPRRLLTFGLAALFLMLFWSIVALVYYSIRDSK